MKKLILICAGLLLLFGAKAQVFARPSEVTFQLISEVDMNPVVQRVVYVYNGDYRFDLDRRFNPYPHDESARKMEWYFTAVKTDGEGRFSLNIKDLKAREIFFQVGEPYRGAVIEKSSDIGHTPSDNHIRIVRFEKGSTRVLSNDIYDLTSSIVKTLMLDGGVEEKPFQDVVLYV